MVLLLGGGCSFYFGIGATAACIFTCLIMPFMPSRVCFIKKKLAAGVEGEAAGWSSCNMNTAYAREWMVGRPD